MLRALLLTDQGEEGPAWADVDVAESVGVTSRSIENWRKRACEVGPGSRSRIDRRNGSSNR
ncbi:MAG: hypothetical protein R3C02_09075 [Planctomycetaceae bacterium]